MIHYSCDILKSLMLLTAQGWLPHYWRLLMLGLLLQESRNCLALSRPKSLFPLCLCTQFQVGLPGSREAKHTLSFWCYPVRVDSVFHSSSWIFSWTPVGSRDAVLCTDHPILGQAVIVLHLDYPNCYESQDAFSSGHVECTSLPHRLDVFLWSHPS